MFGSIKGTLRYRGACGREMRQSPREAHGGKEMMSSRGILGSLYRVNPSQWLPLQVELEGQERWLSYLMICNLF